VSTGAEDKDLPQGQEPFLDRWSRRKAEAKQEPPAAREQDAAAKAPPPDLPPLDQLTPDSDYRAFFHPEVDEDVRRAALKKLFSDPRFNVMDGLDVYIDDYSKTEPIPPAMLAGLRQAQKILEWAKGEDKEAPHDHAKPDEIAHSQPASLESGSTEVAPNPPAGDKVASTVPADQEPVGGSRPSGNS
jgi:Protein of unknown function (DUF3306)